ncbi:MAG: sugar phosphate isomerase/epimerase family protein [Opitutales bacterium]
MKLAFMTLGCPDWDLPTICRRGQQYGYDGVDFRGLQQQLDVTVMPEFTTGAAATKTLLADHGLEISAISSSIRLCQSDARADNLAEAQRHIEVAQTFGVERLRVFGGGDLANHSQEALKAVGIEMMHAILDLDGAADCIWMFETHDHWVAREHALALVNGVDHPRFQVLWDMAHCFRIAEESPQECLQAYGTRITYAHLKDAVYEPENPLALKDGWRYVPAGEGQLPIGEAVEGLKSIGYDGWLQFEHEKRWHRNLDEPEDIFPKFARWARHFC